MGVNETGSTSLSCFKGLLTQSYGDRPGGAGTKISPARKGWEI